MRYLSVCSGIEAASVAWHPLGWQCAGVSEIEPFPRAVLEQRIGAVPVDYDDHRWTDRQNFTPLFGDFTKIEEHHVGPVDLLVGGTPYQSFSVAGKRLGLDDPRGNLTLEFLALAQRVRPRWLVWENVPGILSHDGGRTFGTFLGLLAECGFERWSYRVLDAQYVRVGRFGRAVPQRRRRVFVVGYSGTGGIHPRAVLFDRDSLRGNPAPRREAGQGIAPTLAARTRGGGGLGTDFDCDGGLIAHDVAPTLNAAFGTKLGLEDQHIRGGAECSSSVANTLTRRMHKGINTTCDEGQTLIPMHGGGFDEVAHSLRGEGFDASEDGTGRGTPLVPIAFAQNTRDEVRLFGDDGQTVGALAAEPGMKQTCYIAFPAEMSGTQCASAEDLSPALSVKHTTAIAFSAKDYGADAMADCSPTLRAGGHPGSHPNAGVMPAIAIQERAVSENPDAGPAYTLEARAVTQAVAFSETADCLTAAYGTKWNGNASADNGSLFARVGWRVRRLTPKECERLQAFPDNWTRIEWRGKPADQCPDGPRYKACGNSMAVNVMSWIGERIAAVEAMAEQGEAA